MPKTISLENPGVSNFDPARLCASSEQVQQTKDIYCALQNHGVLKYMSFYHDAYINSAFDQVERWKAFTDETVMENVKALEVKNYSEDGVVTLLHMSANHNNSSRLDWVEVPTGAVSLLLAGEKYNSLRPQKEHILTGAHRVLRKQYAELWDFYMRSVIAEDVKPYTMSKSAVTKYAILCSAHTLIQTPVGVQQLVPLPIIHERLLPLFELGEEYSLARLRVLSIILLKTNLPLNQIKDAPMSWLLDLLPVGQLKKADGFSIGFRSMHT